MKTSSLIRSIADEIKAELLTNTAARPNHAARNRLYSLAGELKHVSAPAAKATEHMLHVADHYYSDSVREKQPQAAPQLHSEMINAVSQLNRFADRFAANGD